MLGPMDPPLARRVATAAERFATYGVPVASVLLAAVVMLGPGAARSSRGVRVAGRPVRGSPVLALRLLAVHRLYGVDDVATGGRLRLEASEAGAPLGAWEGELGPDGVAEAFVRLAQPAERALDVRVTEGRLERAAGRIPLAAPEAPRRGARAIAGYASGEVGLEVAAARGVMAAPFWEDVEVRASGATGGAALHASAPGAELGPPIAPDGSARLGEGGALGLRLRPLAHEVELALEAKDGAGRAGRWEGHLPVVPGAMWLDPAALPGRLVVVTPAPRDRAYVSLVGADGGRLFGASLPLAREAGARAEALLPELPSAADHVLVAGDPLEQGAGTIAWPVAGAFQGAVIPRPVELLLDGVPAAEAREAARARTARRWGMLVLAAAGVLEVLLLAGRSRSAQRRLEAHLAEAAARANEEAGGAPGALVDLSRAAERGLGARLAVYAALVALAFAMVGALASFR
jgi:hypothetical protein